MIVSCAAVACCMQDQAPRAAPTAAALASTARTQVYEVEEEEEEEEEDEVRAQHCTQAALHTAHEPAASCILIT